MAKKKSKTAPREKGSTRPARPRKLRQPRAPAPPPLPLDQELLQLARGAAGSLQRVLLAVLILGAVTSIAAGLWSLRPTPAFSSGDIAAGSPFDVTFKVENRDPWFALPNLTINCVLAQVRAFPIAPTMVEATNVRFDGQQAGSLQPGESGTFKCPLRAVLGLPAEDDADAAQRAEIYFRSEYDLPLIGWPRLTYNSARFSLNTRLLPPRWTSKPTR